MPDKNKKNIEKLDRLLTLMDSDALTREEFTKSFKNVVDVVLKTKKDLQTSFDTKAEAILNKLLKDIKDTKGQNEKQLSDMLKGHTKAIKSIKNGKAGKKGRDGRDGIPGLDADEDVIFERLLKAVPEQRDIILDTPEEVRNKLELLQDKERLEISAIKDLREELDELKKTLKTSKGQGTVVGSVRGAVMSLNLEDYGPLDGVTKTFNLPAMDRVISVHSSSFPRAFIETTDYTWTPTSITFTSEIDAAGTLATGQTVIILYSVT